MVLFIPAVLAIEAVDSASFLRMIGIVPAVYLLIGAGLWEACRFFSALARALPGRAALLFEKQARGTAVALGVAICAVVVVQGANTYRIYFGGTGGRLEVLQGIPRGVDRRREHAGRHAG